MRARLFIALQTPPEIRAMMAATVKVLNASGADVRWEQENKLHCTLKFLGDTDESRIVSVLAAAGLAAADVPPLVLTYAGIGCFPNHHAPRVIWIGIENHGGHLMALQQSLEDALAADGFDREERAFHPHVTLGRVKSQRNVGHLLRTMETVTFTADPVTVREIDVVRSELRPTGSVYTSLKLIPLKG